MPRKNVKHEEYMEECVSRFYELNAPLQTVADKIFSSLKTGQLGAQKDAAIFFEQLTPVNNTPYREKFRSLLVLHGDTPTEATMNQVRKGAAHLSFDLTLKLFCIGSDVRGLSLGEYIQQFVFSFLDPSDTKPSVMTAKKTQNALRELIGSQQLASDLTSEGSVGLSQHGANQNADDIYPWHLVSLNELSLENSKEREGYTLSASFSFSDLRLGFAIVRLKSCQLRLYFDSVKTKEESFKRLSDRFDGLPVRVSPACHDAERTSANTLDHASRISDQEMNWVFNFNPKAVDYLDGFVSQQEFVDVIAVERNGQNSPGMVQAMFYVDQSDLVTDRSSSNEEATTRRAAELLRLAVANQVKSIDEQGNKNLAAHTFRQAQIPIQSET